MDIKVCFKSAWWWKPAIKSVYFIAVCRIIPLKTAERMVNAILKHSFKWRIGKKEWQRVTGFQVTLWRQ
ncbi:hypothetical protein [Paenibacillus ginsengihumi]|uniref:hypothetical protein n=1 Tax=Paenibacillus ginsengihumi TaxID=431596 RepID=UPI0003679DE9|nr:hypothetical protein [Paenibacillus ginsengihumi]